MYDQRIYHDPMNKFRAQELRRNATKEERHLWYDFLKTRPYTVHRQKQFGSYIVDFYIAKASLVIELDGSQHYEPEEQEYDRTRTEYLASLGLFVMRFANTDIHENFEGVCEAIEQKVRELSDERE